MVFPEERHVKSITEEACFAKERGCRVFNLSLCNPLEIYDGAGSAPGPKSSTSWTLRSLYPGKLGGPYCTRRL